VQAGAPELDRRSESWGHGERFANVPAKWTATFDANSWFESVRGKHRPMATRHHVD
jgi:hypothetical protein